MKFLKLSSFFLLLFVLSTNISFAQSEEVDLSEEQKEAVAQNLEEFFAVLDLSEEQQPEFEAITKKYAAQMQEVKDGGGSKMQKLKKVKSIRKEKDAEMEELLTEEQFEVYLEKQKEMQDKMKENRSGK